MAEVCGGADEFSIRFLLATDGDMFRMIQNQNLSELLE
jgi:hypothetical protein